MLVTLEGIIRAGGTAARRMAQQSEPQRQGPMAISATTITTATTTPMAIGCAHNSISIRIDVRLRKGGARGGSPPLHCSSRFCQPRSSCQRLMQAVGTPAADGRRRRATAGDCQQCEKSQFYKAYLRVATASEVWRRWAWRARRDSNYDANVFTYREFFCYNLVRGTSRGAGGGVPLDLLGVLRQNPRANRVNRVRIPSPQPSDENSSNLNRLLGLVFGAESTSVISTAFKSP